MLNIRRAARGLCEMLIIGDLNKDSHVASSTMALQKCVSRRRRKVSTHLQQKEILRASRSRSKKLLGAPGLTTRSKDATRGSWPYY